MFCPNCGVKNEQEANFCGGCGQPIRKKSRAWWMILIAVLCFGVLGGTGYVYMQITKKEALEHSALAETEVEETVVPQPVTIIQQEVVERPDKKTVEKEKTELIQETLPRVFTILTAGGQGSGFLYAKGGFIVTNAHVVSGYTDVIVKNSVGREAPGKVIGISDKYDVALIQSEAHKNLVPLASEASDTKVGTEVIALGSPNGLQNTASIGYLTGVGRDFVDEYIYDKVYQVDVQIENGSSGGPLIDAKSGKVVGINSLLLNKNRRFGFSIPLYSVTPLIEDWMTNPMTDRQVAAVAGVYDYYLPVGSYGNDSDSDNSYDYYESYETYDYEEDYEYDEYTGDAYFYDEWLGDFILEFRTEYELALYHESFNWIDPYLAPGSTAYWEYADYLDEISGEGMLFEFLENRVTDVQIFDNHSIVSTYETFNFRNNAGQEKYYEKEKEYTVVIDMDGSYRIADVRSK